MDNLQTRKKVPSSFVRGFRQTDGRLSDCRSTDRAGWRVRRTRCAGFSGVPCPQHPTSPPSPPSPSSALHHLLPPAAPVAKPVFTPWGNFNCLCVCVFVVSVCVCVIALSVSREYVCMCVPFAFPVALIFSLSQ